MLSDRAAGNQCVFGGDSKRNAPPGNPPCFLCALSVSVVVAAALARDLRSRPLEREAEPDAWAVAGHHRGAHVLELRRVQIEQRRRVGVFLLHEDEDEDPGHE